MSPRRPSGRSVPLFTLLALLLPILLLSAAPAHAQTQTLLATQDTYLKRWRPNRNQGEKRFLRVRRLGRNRTLVQFDQAEIADAVGTGILVSAKLRLYITFYRNIRGKDGQKVAVHRMSQAWTEGGATWNCPDDTNTTNHRSDCTRWNMRKSSEWPFVGTPTDVILHQKGQSGWLEWDVTADVAQFLAGTAENYGWLVKKVKEWRLGRVRYSSREGKFSPKLLLEVSGSPSLPAGFGLVLGQVVDATTGQPLAGITVKALGSDSEVLTDSQGGFELPAPASNRAPIYFNKGGYVDAKVFAVVEAGRESTLGPVRLQPFDQVATIIGPQGGSHTDSTGTVAVIFPAGAVGTDTAVTATVFPTAKDFPVKLPEGSAYLAGVQFTPEGLAFPPDKPVTVRTTNSLNLPAGTNIPFAFANHSDQDPDTVFFDFGTATVSSDGQSIEANLPHFSCIGLVLAILIGRDPFITNPPDQPVLSSNQKCCPSLASRVGAQDGTVFLDQVLPSTRTLGRANPLTLTYSSATADPHPLILTETLLDPAVTTLPQQITWQLRAGPLEEERIFTPQAGASRYALSWEPLDSSGNVLPTGSHRVEVTLSNDYQGTLATTNSFGGPPIQDLGIPTPGLTPASTRPNARVVIHNRQQSPFGAGWGLQGVQRLHLEPDGSVVLTEGDGTALTFRTTPLLYAIVSPGTTAFGGLSAIDPETGDLHFVFPTVIQPNAVTTSPAGDMVFTAGAGGVVFVDARTQKVVGVINTIAFAQDLAVSPDGASLYVVSSKPSRFTIVDVRSRQVVSSFGLSGVGVAVTLSPDGSLAYVGQQLTNDVAVIDTQSLSVVATIPLGTTVVARAMVLSGDGQTLYVGISTGVAVIDTSTNSLQSTLSLSRAAFGLALTPAGRLFAIHRTTTVTIIDTSTLQVAGTVTLPVPSADAITVSPDGQRVFATGGEGFFQFMGFVFVLDATTGAIVEQFSLPDGVPEGLAFRLGDSDRPLAPPGDFSTLTRNDQGTPSDPFDDTWVRRMKDGTKHVFSASGLHLQTVDRNGNTVSYEYDVQDRLLSVTDPGSGVTSFSYAGGKLTSVTDPAGRTTQFTIDGAGNLVTVITPDGASTQYSYDSRHRLITRTDPRTGVTQYQYDSFGRLSRAIHPTGEERTLLPSDAQALLNNVPPGTPATPISVDVLAQLTDGLTRTTQIETDRLGAATQTIDPVGRTTVIERNGDGLPLTITRPDGAVIDLSYDTAGNVLSTKQTDPSVGVVQTFFTYEPVFNQVTSITDPEGNTTTISYDVNGNPTQITDALTNTTSLVYDSRGLLTSVTDVLGNVTTFTYDGRGNLITTTDPLGNTTSLSYDAAGNVVSSTDAQGRATAFAYDPMNRLTEVTDGAGGVTQYTYDGIGNLVSVRDAKGQTTTFAYDEVNQLTQTTNPLGQSKTFTYDLARNLVNTTDAKAQTITFAYDAANQLIQKSLPGGEVVSFDYDVNGNLTLAQDVDSNLTFQYDARNRLKRVDVAPTVAQPASTIFYIYDKNGNRTQQSGSGGTSGLFATYAYDALNRLTRFTGSRGRTTFAYDVIGRRTSMTLPNGVVANYTYDAASQLTSLLHQRAGSPIASSSYTYDDVGNRTTLTDLDGPHSFVYDNLNRLTDATHPQPANPAENFTYDPVGNRTTSHLATGQVHDVANRLLEDSNFTYAYDANGNLASKTNKATLQVTTYTYDAENQLIQVDEPGLVAEYRYDALGRRIEKNVNGVITRYIYDNEDIAVELDGANLVRANYAHGPGIDEPLAVFRGAEGGLFVYHADGLGSITTLTTNTGTVARSFTYDSFGQIVAETGTVTNPYTYTGREFDPETGLYYYRTRYYDPVTSRFLQEDQLSLKNLRASRRSLPNELNSRRLLSNPELQNLYVYATNNPIIFADPFGLFSVDVGLGGTIGILDITYGFISGKWNVNVTNPQLGAGGFACFNLCDESSRNPSAICPQDPPAEPLPISVTVGSGRRSGLSVSSDLCTICINVGVPILVAPVSVGIPITFD